MENGADSPGEAKDPSGFLSALHGAPVTVKLNSGLIYKGELQSVDGYMNIALENAREYTEGITSDKPNRTFNDAFVRGNNVMYISAD